MTRIDTINHIAKQHMRIETLTAQNCDRLDFHELAVWSIEAALQAAFQAGQQAAKGCNACKAGQA